MTPQQKAEARQRSEEGSGPRIVSKEFVRHLEQSDAPKHLVKAARRALATNPV
jgi:hypothetical protein